MSFLNQIEPWHWLVLMFLCLGMEALGTGGFLLGSAAAALILSVGLWLFPETGGAAQLVWFGVLSLILSAGYWKFFRKLNNKNDYPELNNRASQLVGHTFLLTDDLPSVHSRVQIGDTLWKVQADKVYAKGTSVVVIDYERMVLFIKETE